MKRFQINKALLLSSMVVSLLWITTMCSAQSTKVYGRIFDGNTGEPLPFVNINFKGTKIGTTSDIDGNYKIESYYASDSIMASFVGYTPVVKKVKKDQSQKIDFALFETSVELSNIVVTAPKEDPAITIIKHTVKNKKINDREKLESYKYETYNKVEFDLNNITEEFKEKRLFRKFDFIFDNVDSSEEKLFLPIFMTESLSDYYFRKNPKAEKEIIKATKISGVKQDNMSEFLGDMYQNVNVYDNFPIIFGKSFVSPVSNVCFVYYDYYLLDSAYLNNRWCYQIRFVPKRKHELTFVGDMWINDTTYAIKQIETDISGDANINFINDMHIKQTFDEVEKEVWMLTEDKIVIDFVVSKKTQGIYGRKTSSYSNFIINKPMNDEFYNSGGDILLINDSVNDQTQEFWEEHRHDSLTKNEKSIYAMMDTLDNVPIVHTYIDIIATIFTGYKVWGKVEIGPYFNMYSHNPIEGHRFRLGGRTSNDFSTRIEFSGYGAYGLLDKKFKYEGGFRYMFSKKPRQMIAAYYQNDVEQLGQSQDAFTTDNFISSFFRRPDSWKLTQTEQFKALYEYEWFEGFLNQLMFRHRILDPLGDLQYNYFDQTGELQTLNNITSTDITLYTRFAYHEKFIAGEFDRVSLDTKSPILEMQFTYGIKDLWNSQYEYTKLTLSVKDKYYLGPMGDLRIRTEAGKIWGTLPYPLLNIHIGNETYYYYDNAFNTMNFYEFISDQYVKASAEWHLGGIIFNHIPLLRKLKWREVITAKSVWGTLNDKNFLLLDSNMYRLKAKPFAEAAVGIENIFKIFRVDALFRLTYLDHTNIIKWGIRAELQIDF